MTGHHFISYSRREAQAQELALRLYEELRSGSPAFAMWLDKRDIRLGREYDDEIAEAIDACRSVLFVMSRDSVTPQSGCKWEWTRARNRKKAIIPILLHFDAERPMMLGNRQHIDFTEAIEPALAELRRHLHWLSSPAGVLQDVFE